MILNDDKERKKGEKWKRHEVSHRDREERDREEKLKSDLDMKGKSGKNKIEEGVRRREKGEKTTGSKMKMCSEEKYGVNECPQMHLLHRSSAF